MKIFAAAAVLVASSAGEGRSSPSEPDKRVLQLLGGAHGAPTRAVLLAASPDAKAMLVAIARDADVAPLFRGRAISALSAWPEPDVQSLFVALLHDPAVTGLLRHRILLAHARAFPRAALAEIAAALEGSDLELRLTAVTALALVPGPEAEQYLARAARAPQPAAVRAEAARVAARLAGRD